MKKLEQLDQIAGRQLGGLTATGKMLGEIKLKATQEKPSFFRFRPAVAIFTTVLLGALSMALLFQGGIPSNPDALILESQPAGDGVQQMASQTMLNLAGGSVTVGGGAEAPSYRNLFAEAKGSNFPVILVNGAAYRMLKTPPSVNRSLLGGKLGEITEYTLEPALSSSEMTSNAAKTGEAVYLIQGMQGAMVAAEVDGDMRVFQRVSFAGTAVMGNETLADTLCRAADVVSVELSGVGAVNQQEEAQRLAGILLSNASYQSASASSSGSQSLLLGLRNGLTLQLMVSGDSVSACGTWSCPEFFETFAQVTAK